MTLVSFCARHRFVLGACLALAAGNALSDNFSTVHIFTGGADGSSPVGRLVRAADGTLYGTTGSTSNGAGSVFKITTAGVLSTIHTFTGVAEGSNPYGLTVGSDGNLYGVTALGGQDASGRCEGTAGPQGCGTVFKMSTAGSLTTLYTFSGRSDGGTPNGVVEGADNNLYGTTQIGGASDDGLLFRVTRTGTYTPLHVFSGADGASPYGNGTLIAGSDGNLYGTTSAGGNSTACGRRAPGCGTVFKATPAGDVTTLHVFTGGATDGGYPFGIIQGSDGSLYGTTFDGGASGDGVIYKLTPGSPGPTFVTLHSFLASTDGNASTGLVQASGTEFFGTATLGGSGACGSAGCGTLFQFSTAGTAAVTVLHNFSSSVDGGDPFGLVLGSDNNLYGLTGFIGGTTGVGAPQGSVFRYALAGGGSSSSGGGSSSSSGSSGGSGGGGGGGAAGVAMIGGLSALAALRRRRPLK